MQREIHSAPTLVYPSSDGKPMAETDKHRKLMVDFIQMLEHHFSVKSGHFTKNLACFLPSLARRGTGDQRFPMLLSGNLRYPNALKGGSDKWRIAILPLKQFGKRFNWRLMKRQTSLPV